jgi:hypothetical protein
MLADLIAPCIQIGKRDGYFSEQINGAWDHHRFCL